MRIVSVSEYEAGIIAIGNAPFGIIAIGGFPVGVIAVGILPMGLLSFACGAGLGVVNFTVGVGFGAYVRAIGLAFGGDAESMGLRLGIAGTRPRPRGKLRETQSPEAILASDGEAWVRTQVLSDGSLKGLPARVDMDDDLRVVADKLRKRSVYARLRSVQPAASPLQSYRESSRPPDPHFVCSDLIDATVKFPRWSLAWYGLRVLLVAAVVLGVLAYVTRARLGITKMTRVVKTSWQARAHKLRGNGLGIAENARCQVKATLRGDGERRLHATILVRCGDVVLFHRKLRSGCTLAQHTAGSAYRYKMRCFAARIPRSEDDDGNVRREEPGLVLDTFAVPAYARVWKEGPRHPVNLRLLMTDALSRPVSGDPLFPKGGSRPGRKAGMKPEPPQGTSP